jgi:long-chain acyl-CoA synthetase
MVEDQLPKILQNLPSRIGDVLKPWAENSPDHPALVESSGTLTYSQLAFAVTSAQMWLEDCAVRPGDRVMLVCENCRALVVLFLALTNINAWPVLVNARLSANELDQIRDHCGARRIIYLNGVSPHAAKHATRHNAETQDFMGLGQIAIGPLNDAATPEPLDATIKNNVAALIYTSGTTGLPKGVMLTHGNLLFMASSSCQIRSINPQDRLYGILPMSHAVGLSVVLLGSLIAGATLYLAPRFDPVAVLSLFEKEKITILLGAPSVFSLLLEYAKMKGIESLRFPDLRIISSSGAPLQASIKTATEKLFGLTLHNGYGVTECSPTIALTRPESPRSDLTVGRIFPGIEIRFVDPAGNPVAAGDVGELHVRGPNVMKGYYRSPEETAAAVDSNGWFNTRDLARLQDDYLYIEGRSKELIVRFGFNVYPAEVESVLNSNPEILRSAVIGRSLRGSGEEEIIAFVQLQPGSVATSEELANFAAQRLTPYKQPSQIIILSEIPLTPTGKARKDELAKILASQNS